VAQVVEHLPNKHKAVIQFLIPQKERKKEKWGDGAGGMVQALEHLS
jgi:hypothetical protein